MDYVEQFKICGVDTRQVACILLHGKPNAATQGAVGVLGVDVDSPLHDVYKCVAVNGGIYTWELLSSGLSIMSANISGGGTESVQFPYSNLRTPAMYVVKIGDLILDKEGYLYQIDSLNSTYCIATYCGTQVVAYGKSAYVLAVENGFEGTEEEWLASLKGEKGDPASVTDYITHETGDSEDLVMSQKGATKIANDVAASVLILKSGTATLPFSSTGVVGYGDGRFVALGPNGKGAYSDNGVVWNEISLPVSQSYWYFVAYGGGKFIASTGDGGDASIICSSDGVTWTISNTPEISAIFSGVYGDGKFVILSIFNGIYCSEDGITWTAGGSLPYYSNDSIIAYGNGMFVAMRSTTDGDDGVAAYSPDGITWTTTTIPSGFYASCLAYGNGKFVAIQPDSTNAIYSEDGITWKETILPTSEDWSCLAYGNERFVLIAHNSNKHYYSVDGITWTKAETKYMADPSVAFGNGKFVVVQNRSNVDYAYISHFGIEWTKTDSWIEQNGVDVTADVRSILCI